MDDDELIVVSKRRRRGRFFFVAFFYCLRYYTHLSLYIPFLSVCFVFLPFFYELLHFQCMCPSLVDDVILYFYSVPFVGSVLGRRGIVRN